MVQAVWNRHDVVATYAQRRYITPAEVRVFAECWPALCGGSVLDIGVGTGRTTRYLAPVAKRYTAIDYMPNMVTEARRQFPGCDIRRGDARNLAFDDGTFSVVVFSFNGIDYVEPRDRPRVLSEVQRVLAPGGVFLYSTHNLTSRTGEPKFEVELPELGRLITDPLRTAITAGRTLAATLRGYRNYRRLSGMQQIGFDVAFINDGAHDYSLLTCYVTREHEESALAAAGFRLRHVIDPDGTISARSSRARDLYFVADRA
jgi:SAM-dependent methyltransferase